MMCRPILYTDIWELENSHIGIQDDYNGIKFHKMFLFTIDNKINPCKKK